MEDLTVKIKTAKEDTESMNHLISEYMPFLKKEIAKYSEMRLAYDERLSLAMLVFVNCVRQYQESSGNFISFLSVSIKNRLIDQVRVNNKEGNVISLDKKDADIEDETEHIQNKISVQIYKKEEEESVLKEEIKAFNEELKEHLLSFGTLQNSCPKQKRSRKLCIGIAREIAISSSMRKSFETTGRLPQLEVSLKMGISTKTIEKYRKYIVALVILILGDYGAITSFIPMHDEDFKKEELK